MRSCRHPVRRGYFRFRAGSKMRPVKRGRPLFMAAVRIAALAPLLALGAAPAMPPLRLAPGLIFTAAIQDKIDYEFFRVIQRVDDQGVRTANRWLTPDANAPGGQRQETAMELIRSADRETARRIVLVHVKGDPETFPGATSGSVSRVIYRELTTTGKAAVVLGAARLNAGDLLGGMLAGRKYYRGNLERVEPAAVRMPMLVDGLRTTLPAIHVRGTVSVGSESEAIEMWILDDPSTPLTLKWSGFGAVAQTVRIDNPPTPEARGEVQGGSIGIQQGLAGRNCRAELHGLYFSTGSAAMLPESTPALVQIADVLRGEPAWSVAIEGHTDSTGAAATNQALSQQRAEAVRHALVGQFGIAASRLTASGFGSTRPVESNTTLEGRARNRRVELARHCP